MPQPERGSSKSTPSAKTTSAPAQSKRSPASSSAGASRAKRFQRRPGTRLAFNQQRRIDQGEGFAKLARGPSRGGRGAASKAQRADHRSGQTDRRGHVVEL